MQLTRALLVLAVVLLHHSVQSQKSEIQFVNNCFNVDGGVLFCLELSVQSCDAEWFYQILSPPNENGVSFVIDTKIVQSGESSTECYDVEYHDQCQYCVSFLNSVVEGVDMHAALHVDLICPEGTVSYPHQIIRSQGLECGNDGYNYLPCESQSNTLEFPEPPTSNAVFSEQGDCLFIGRENPQIYCPALLMDTCTETGLVETLNGYRLTIPLDSDPVCAELDDGNICQTATVSNYQVHDDYISVTAVVRFLLEYSGEDQAYATSLTIHRHYPVCGESLADVCLTDWPIIINENPDATESIVEVDEASSSLYYLMVIAGIVGVVGVCLLIIVAVLCAVRVGRKPAPYQLVSY